MRRFWTFLSNAIAFLPLAPGQAIAHVSEQGLVLLLPTGHYIASGVASVVATIILISFTPRQSLERLFKPVVLPRVPLPPYLQTAVSLLSFVALAAMVYIGLTGPRDPLVNILPLMIWTGFWIALVSIAGLFGNPWRYLNPWTGVHYLVVGSGACGLVRLPKWIGLAPGLVQFVLFSAFYIADPAPQDPDRLAMVVAGYWLVNFAAIVVFGVADWMERGEAFSILFRLISRVSLTGDGSRHAVGVPGWAIVEAPARALGLGAFALVMLGAGSFDGLKETFWWLAAIGVNPLEFPGRSAMVVSSVCGLAFALIALCAAFLVALWAGARLAAAGLPPSDRQSVTTLFAAFAPALLPIALGYHLAHFLISFLIDGQYLLAALADLLPNGNRLFGRSGTKVTTGFLATPSSVKTIWLTQATIVVAGHIVSILVSHAIAVKAFGNVRRASLSQIPVGVFMVAYTFFGLWLLASPRGV